MALARYKSVNVRAKERFRVNLALNFTFLVKCREGI